MRLVVTVIGLMTNSLYFDWLELCK